MWFFDHSRISSTFNNPTLPKYIREMFDKNFTYTIDNTKKGIKYLSYRTDFNTARLRGLARMNLWLNIELGYITEEEALTALLPEESPGVLIALYKAEKKINDLYNGVLSKYKTFSFYHNEDLSNNKDNPDFKAILNTSYKCSAPIDIRGSIDEHSPYRPNTKLILDIDGEEQTITYYRPTFKEIYEKSKVVPDNKQGREYSNISFYPFITPDKIESYKEEWQYFCNRLNIPSPEADYRDCLADRSSEKLSNLKKLIPWFSVVKKDDPLGQEGIGFYPTSYNYFLIPEHDKTILADIKNPTSLVLAATPVSTVSISNLDRVPRISYGDNNAVPTKGTVEIQFSNQLDSEGKIKWNSFTPPNNQFDSAFFARVLATGSPTTLRFEGRIDVMPNACTNNKTIKEFQFSHDFTGSIGNMAFATGLNANNGIVTKVPTVFPHGITGMAYNAFYGRRFTNIIAINPRIAIAFSGSTVRIDKNMTIPEMGTMSDEEKCYYYFFYGDDIQLDISVDGYLASSIQNPTRRPAVKFPYERFMKVYRQLIKCVDPTHTSGIALANTYANHLNDSSNMQQTKAFGVLVANTVGKNPGLSSDEQGWFQALGEYLSKTMDNYTYDKVLTFCYDLPEIVQSKLSESIRYKDNTLSNYTVLKSPTYIGQIYCN